MKLEGKRIFLRPLVKSDATLQYVQWLNDPEVNRYLESRFLQHSVESVREFIRENQSSPPRFFAICLQDGRHVGNIKVGKPQEHHCYADVGLLIGDKAQWGKGFATEAIRLVKDYCFSELGLNKLLAGAYSINVGSWKAFEKAGFVREACFTRKYLCGEQWVDEIVMAANNPFGISGETACK